MREILFRGKSTYGREWVEGYYVYNFWGRGDHTIFIPREDGSSGSAEVDPSTVCQYTGLKDKNGEKIWENDIVEIPREDEFFLVSWSETEAMYQMTSEVEALTVDFDNYWSYEVEVIGNIFDNKELLETE